MEAFTCKQRLMINGLSNRNCCILRKGSISQMILTSENACVGLPAIAVDVPSCDKKFVC
jgi:hypothetical protein